MGASHTSCVFWAAQEGRCDDLLYHLDCSSSDTKEVVSVKHTDKQWTPLHAAVVRGHQQCVRILYEAGERLKKQFNVLEYMDCR